MLYLEGSHKTVVDTLYAILSGAKPTSQKVKVGDFHGTQWCVRYDPEENNLVVAVSFAADPKQLEGWGMQDLLQKAYGAALVSPADLPEDLHEDRYMAAVKVECPEKLPDGDLLLPKAEADKITEKCVHAAELYFVCITAAFRHAFEEANAGKTFAPFKLAYRDTEALYLGASKDNVCMYTSMTFDTADDLLFGRIFLQEFVDAKKHEKSIAAAPGCDMSNKRPRDLSAVKGVEPEDEEHRLWVTIILQTPRHTDTKPEALKKTVEYLVNFRNYVQYHIKCAKTFMNGKMRARHADLLKVLARAKTDQTGQSTVQLE